MPSIFKGVYLWRFSIADFGFWIKSGNAARCYFTHKLEACATLGDSRIAPTITVKMAVPPKITAEDGYAAFVKKIFNAISHRHGGYYKNIPELNKGKIH